MTMKRSRLGMAAAAPRCAPGWRATQLVGPSSLVSPNGIRWGPDNRLYIAQAFGSQISVLDIDSGDVEIVSDSGGGLGSPDDVAFDDHGNLFTTELMYDRVSVLDRNGSVETFASGISVANGLTVVGERVFVTEFIAGGRILEIFSGGRTPRVIARDLMFPNALSLGADGNLYFPESIPGGAVSRVPLLGGQVERVVGDLQFPTAVKFDAAGNLFVVEAGNGAISQIDSQTQRRQILANTERGIDNLEFSPSGSIIVSNWNDGSIREIDRKTVAARELVKGAVLGPFGLAVAPDGALIVADGLSTAKILADGQISRPIVAAQEGAPPWMRGVVVSADGAFIFSSPNGTINRYTPATGAVVLKSDLQDPMGVAIDHDGAILVCEAGAGRLLKVRESGEVDTVARGLARPMGVCTVGSDIFVSEAAGGRVSAVHGTNDVTAVLTGLAEPHGLAGQGSSLFALDRAAGQLWQHDTETGSSSEILAGLATDALATGIRNVPRGVDGGPMQGPLSPFSDVAAFADGRVCVGSNSDGVIWQLVRADL
jgi:sugar lactone lactonase YvrE